MTMSGYDVLLLRNVRDLLTETIRTKSDEVATGVSRGDLFDYGKRCGHIQGMKDALAMLENEAARLMGEDRKDA